MANINPCDVEPRAENREEGESRSYGPTVCRAPMGASCAVTMYPHQAWMRSLRSRRGGCLPISHSRNSHRALEFTAGTGSRCDTGEAGQAPQVGLPTSRPGLPSQPGSCHGIRLGWGLGCMYRGRYSAPVSCCLSERSYAGALVSLGGLGGPCGGQHRTGAGAGVNAETECASGSSPHGQGHGMWSQ